MDTDEGPERLTLDGTGRSDVAVGINLDLGTGPAHVEVGLDNHVCC